MNVLDKLNERFQDVFLNGEIYSDPMLWVLFIAIILWLMSACWASSIAESRHLHPKTHFLWGLIIPFIYPIRFRSSGEGARKVSKEREQAQAEMQQMQEEAEQAEEPEYVPISWDENYFREFIAVEDEKYQSFRLMLNGHEVTVIKILECQPTLMVAEIKDENKNLKRLRIPYERIEQCQAL